MDKGKETVRKRLRYLFGEVQWNAPPWAVTLNDARRSRARRFWAVLAGILLIPLLIVGGRHFLQMLPQPVLTHIDIEAPGITEVGADGKLYPQPMFLNFHADYADAREEGPRNAARLALLGKTLTKEVTLEPNLRGEWQWVNERQLRFQPQEDWPAQQQYRVLLQPELFADGVQLAENRPSFTTPSISGELKKLAFYQNPEKPSEHKVVATVRFSHQVEAENLKRHLRLTMRASGEAVDTKPAEHSYTLRLGEHGREAYITTAPLALPEQENL